MSLAFEKYQIMVILTTALNQFNEQSILIITLPRQTKQPSVSLLVFSTIGIA